MSSSKEYTPFHDLSELEFAATKTKGVDQGAMYRDLDTGKTIMVKGRPTGEGGVLKEWPSGPQQYNASGYIKESFFGEVYTAILGEEHTPKTMLLTDTARGDGVVYAGSEMIPGFKGISTAPVYGGKEPIALHGLEKALVTAMLLGESDLIDGNLGYVDREDGTRNFIKIDHGKAGEKLTRGIISTNLTDYDASDEDGFKKLAKTKTGYTHKTGMPEFNQQAITNAVYDVSHFEIDKLRAIAEKYDPIMSGKASAIVGTIAARQEQLQFVSRSMEEAGMLATIDGTSMPGRGDVAAAATMASRLTDDALAMEPTDGVGGKSASVSVSASSGVASLRGRFGGSSITAKAAPAPLAPTMASRLTDDALAMEPTDGVGGKAASASVSAEPSFAEKRAMFNRSSQVATSGSRVGLSAAVKSAATAAPVVKPLSLASTTEQTNSLAAAPPPAITRAADSPSV